MNFQGNDFLRVVCLGLLLPVVVCVAAVRMGKQEQPPIPSSTGKQTMPSTDQPAPEQQMRVFVLQGDQMAEMDLETYLVGVVLAEMPASFETEALKAQAVAARTYTIKHCTNSDRHENSVICTDHTCCQAYIEPREYVSAGGSWSSVERVQQAVADTRGMVLVYGKDLIEATYFSCAGGMTEDAAAVWGQDLPYLQAVVSPGEENAEHYTDSKTFTPEQFQIALGIRLTGPVGSWFGDVTFTEGGGVNTLTIGGVAYRGTTLRTLLELRSTAFTISVTDDVITFHTKGYGHRVGMSQYGANAMALTGKDFRQILTHYYSGAEIVHYDLQNK